MYAKITILGNLGSDPSVHEFQSGTKVCTFSVATARYDRRINANMTEWFRVKVFGKMADTCEEYLYKGKQVLVNGDLAVEKWKSKSGEDKYTLEVISNDIKFIGGLKKEEQGEDDEDDNYVPF